MNPFLESAGLESAGLLFVLLNPFLMSIYLVDLFRKLDLGTFARVLARGAAIACCVFFALSWVGEALFTEVLQVRFAAFVLDVTGRVMALVVGTLAVEMILQGLEWWGQLPSLS